MIGISEDFSVLPRMVAKYLNAQVRRNEKRESLPPSLRLCTRYFADIVHQCSFPYMLRPSETWTVEA
jgi:20S proteasome alpha/beta subunit